MRQALGAGLPFARRHGLVRDEEIVQPTGAGQSDLVGGVEHARGIAQQRARVIDRQRLQKRFRCESGPASEQVVQLVRGDARGIGDRVDRTAGRANGRGYARWRGDHGIVVGGARERGRIRDAVRAKAWRSPSSLPSAKSPGVAGCHPVSGRVWRGLRAPCGLARAWLRRSPPPARWRSSPSRRGRGR